MKKLTTAILILMLLTSLTIPTRASAAQYNFDSGDLPPAFGGATSIDTFVTPAPMDENVRRNKDNSALPPPYGIFSGFIPTDTSSPYHDNSPVYAGTSGSATVYTDNASSVNSSAYSGNSASVTIAELPSVFLPTTSVTTAQITEPLYYDNGTIGTLYIDKLSKSINVYEGESLENLKLGIGHFSYTSTWDGNVGIAGHNRGTAAYFSFVKDLKIGDTLTYSTRYGSRTYKIYSKEQVSEYDSSSLGWSADNIITMITCVENVPELRWCVQAIQI
jgi:sortase A